MGTSSRETRLLPLASDKTYGFFELSQLPSGEPLRVISLSPLPEEFAVTGDYTKEAKNHCAAVTSTNVSLILAAQGYPDALPRIPSSSVRSLSSRDISQSTFTRIHDVIGNGPIVNLEKLIGRYTENANTAIRCRKRKGPDDIAKALSSNHPVALMVADSLFQWHWITVLEWREYPGNQIYFVIADSWHRTPRAYRPNYGSRILRILEFYI